ncbi:transportin-1 [Capsella rubella]|uniref:transportin-1 n=1 Tax=Capsella rubella TaxID=81985 RepID=UPI000CD527BE|nr:transportin-1 [Capsella rubella]
MEFKAHMFREMILYEWRQANVQEEDLKRILPTLVQSFLKDMAYKNSDETLLDAEVRDDDSPNVWTLRKRGEEKVYMFSYVFGHELFQILMPLAQAKLRRFDDETWKEREAIVFALGTVSKGCIRSFQPRHLAMLVVLLVPLLDDLCPLIRSKSCWTLSQYGAYLLKGSQHRSYQHFERVLDGVLRKLLDVNIRVQNAACVAFTTLAKDAGEDLVLYLEVMLEHIIRAFGTAQRENIEIVYNAIRTMPNLVGGEMITKLEILIPQLVAKWEQHSDSDKDLYLMLECFTSISVALDVGSVPFAQAVFKRCIQIMEKQNLAKVGISAVTEYEKETILYSIAFLYDLAEWFGSGIEYLLEESNLRLMLLGYCMDKDPDVKERAFALMGVLARVHPVYIQPLLHEFLDIASKQTGVDVIRENVNVAANACRTIGELAVKFYQEFSSLIVTNVVLSLSIILHQGEVWDNKALIEVISITLARLAWNFPELVAPQMEHYFEPWCKSFSMIDDDSKKETFRGLCAMVTMNPLGVGSSLFFICQVIANWHHGYLDTLMYPLIAKLNQLSISDKDIFPLLRCFASISQPLGVRFAPFALPVFQRCMDIIGIQELAKVGLAPAGAQYDKGFIIHSLEFIYELVGGLKSGIESLVSQSYLRDMLIQCCKDESPDVRERAFALMGALARVFPVYLQPRLREFIEIASHQLIIENITSETLYVAANACWAIGHLAVKVGQEMSPFVVKFVSSLCWILGHNEGFNMALVDSSAITIGRLAWIRPDLVAPLMEHFIEPWCMNLSMLIDSNKKEDAIRGLCAAVKLNPSGVSESLYFICTAIGSFHEIKSEDVKIEVSEVLNVYKNMMGRSSWKQWLSRLDPLVKERLAIYEV